MVMRADEVPSPRVRRLFDYWRQHCAGGALMPRGAFDPIDLGPLLPNLLFIEVLAEPPDLRIRVAGQEVEDRYGRSMRGMSIYDTLPLVRRKDTSHQWSEILVDRQPKYRRGPMVFPGDRVFEAERIMVPLCDEKRGGPEEVAFILAAVFYVPLPTDRVELTAATATLTA